MLHPQVLRLVVVSTFALQVWGQNSERTFLWKFGNNYLTEQLPICQERQVIVFPQNATAGNFSGVPPYYMMAFPQGGQPITSHIGDDNDTLSWIPNHPVGTKLILHLVDSTGHSGGTSGQIFEITPNINNNDCVAPPPPKDFTISSNTTQDEKGTIETCKPWRLDIHGGNPPYTIVLDAMKSPLITNITQTTDALVFIDRADPDTVLFASVVDVLGRWAGGTQFVATHGQTDVNCTGFNTLSTTQAKLNQEEAQLKAAQDSKRRTSIIVGVVVSLISLSLIVGGVGTWLYMRRRKARKMDVDAQDVTPRQFIRTGAAGQVLSINNFITSSASTTPSPAKSNFGYGIHALPYTEPYNESVGQDVDPNRFSSGSSQEASANLRSRPSFANFPATSVRRSKAQEAARDAIHDPEGTALNRGQSARPAVQPVWPARSGSLQTSTLSPSESEIVYQHEDAGQIVRELPPPYIAPPDVTNYHGNSEERM